MCRIVEECVMEAEARMIVKMTEALSEKVESIGQACALLDLSMEEYRRAKEYLIQIQAV